MERKGVALQLIRSVEQYSRDAAEEDRIEGELRRERSKSSPLAGAEVRVHRPTPFRRHSTRWVRTQLLSAPRGAMVTASHLLGYGDASTARSITSPEAGVLSPLATRTQADTLLRALWMDSQSGAPQ